MKRKLILLNFTLLLTMLLLFQTAWAASGTTVQNVRVGIHPRFTRLVFDSEGARPFRIGSISRESITVYYKKVNLLVKSEHLSRKARGAIANVRYGEAKNVSFFTVTFRYPDTWVKSFYLPADPPKKGAYMLVLDFYARKSPASKKTAPPLTPPPSGKGAGTRSRSKKAEVTKASQEPEPTAADVSAEDDPRPQSTFTGEASVIGQIIKGEDESAKFTEYRDFEPITGELEILYEKKDKYFTRFEAEHIGQEDQYYNFVAGRYGKYKIDLSYDEIPHRFAFDAKNIYSGAGTGDLTLSNTQDVLFADRVNRLNALLADAELLDVELQRKKGQVNADVVAFDPFSFRVEVGREDREGTRPYFGAFGLDNTVEIPQPIDYDTTDLKLIGEYAKGGLFFNASYQFSQFKNNIDSLTWDNPFRATDAVGAPSTGRIDLVPDNEYHNLGVAGSYVGLPLRTRISANASWGRMKQDDALLPYTTNTAITTPSGEDASDRSSLPQQRVDAEVNTTLYNVSLTSRPSSFMNVKGRFRYFEYDNKTEQINFPGFVSADSFFVTPNVPGATSIVNLPTSYAKTTAGLDLGFNVFKKSKLTLGYTYEKMDRTNREVASQKDNKFLGSFDTSPFSWLDLGLSYVRTDREISEYDFDIYLEGGQDLFQLPGLRKYDEADMVRDRLQFLATLYPLDPLVLSGSFIYGEDEFTNSPYGLLEDRHYIFTFEADYTVTDRANLYAFYSYEKYKNRQKARGEVPSEPMPVDSDWFSRSVDVVNSVGAGLRLDLIPKKLNFDLSYSYSHVDGKLDFFTPAVVTAEFPVVDETKLHTLDAKLKYRVWKGLSFTLGGLFEKFQYDDFNTVGFTNIPTDPAGNYNGAYLMGTLPADYDASVVYIKATYRW